MQQVFRSGQGRQEAGFTLAEIKRILESWYSGTFPRKEQIKLIDAKIAEIDAKIRQLKGTRRRLEGMKKEIQSGKC